MQPIIHQNHIDITPDVLMMLGADVHTAAATADGRAGHRDPPGCLSVKAGSRRPNGSSNES